MSDVLDLVDFPIVDFSACDLNKPLSLESDEVKKTLDKVADCLEQHGCLYITNHGLEPDVFTAPQKAARQFFHLPKEEKIKCVRKADRVNNGWVGDGMESLGDNYEGDLKECLAVAYGDIDKFHWPDESVIPGFRAAHKSFCTKLNLLARRLLKLLGTKYSPEDSTIFTRALKNFETGRNNYSSMRHQYYPALSKYVNGIRPGQVRCSQHSDYGIFTFLFQDQRGGLQGQSRDGKWYDVPPLDGGILVQAGDMLEIWTAGRIKAMVHRVINPTDENEQDLARESIVFYVQPDNDFEVRCLDGSDTYAPTNSEIYIRLKMNEIQASDEEVLRNLEEK